MFRGFTGCGTALVTPFRKDLSLDEETMRRLVRRQIEAGINFLVPCGTTGESPTLSREEHLRVVAITIEEAKGKVPVLAGAGGYDTHHVIEMAREAERLGADGILSVTPYYNKPTQEGLYHHFKAIAESISLPIILYNVPPRTNVNIDPATVRRLAEIENIIGVKEASGSISQITQVIQQAPEAFLVLSGDDALTLPIAAMGGRGIISVASNEIPAEMTKLARLCLKPGEKLPPERELAGMFHVSRGSLRDAVRALEVTGFVEARHGEGTVVRAPSADSLLNPLTAALLHRREFIGELLEFRAMIEPVLAKRAARNASPEDLQRLEEIIRRQQEKVNRGELAIEEDTEFHNSIAHAAKNEVVLNVLDVFMDLLRESREQSLQVEGRLQKSLEGHRQILHAIERRDPEAAEAAMRRHIEKIEGIVLNKM